MSRLTVQLRNKKEAVRAAERDAEARRRGYMIEDAVMAAHPDIPTAQKEIQRTEVRSMTSAQYLQLCGHSEFPSNCHCLGYGWHVLPRTTWWQQAQPPCAGT